MAQQDSKWSKHEAFLVISLQNSWESFTKSLRWVHKILEEADPKWPLRNWEGHSDPDLASASLDQVQTWSLCIWTCAMGANTWMLQKVGFEVLAVSLCWEYPPKCEFHSLDLPFGAATLFSAVTLLPLDLFLAPALSTLMEWKHLPKIINCVNIFAVLLILRRIFLPCSKPKCYFPVLRRFIILFFIFCSGYVFDTSLVIRIKPDTVGNRKCLPALHFIL